MSIVTKLLSSSVLLALRIVFGYGFLLAGIMKLGPEAQEMTTKGISDGGFPLNATLGYYLITYTEIIGGTSMLLGLGARILSIPLIIGMVSALFIAPWSPDNVAWMQGSIDWLNSIPVIGWLNGFVVSAWSCLHKLWVQNPTPYLTASLFILAMGPGMFSFDAIIKKCRYSDDD